MILIVATIINSTNQDIGYGGIQARVGNKLKIISMRMKMFREGIKLNRTNPTLEIFEKKSTKFITQQAGAELSQTENGLSLV